MKHTTAKAIFFGSLLLFTIAACSEKEKTPPPSQDIIVISASGNIQPGMDEFRQLLGNLNTAPGATGGRREINWDGVPEEMLNKKLPEDFFNPTEPGSPVANQRGLKYTPTGNFQVSRTNFTEINEGAATEFASFSGNQNFANISGKLWDVEFEIPGQAIAARVQGFGIVFSDVDLANSSSLEFFDGSKSLGKFFAPVHNAGSSFSFLGVYFKNERITRIRVEHAGPLDQGNLDISDGGTEDLVVMDDFIYSEPVQ